MDKYAKATKILRYETEDPWDLTESDVDDIKAAIAVLEQAERWGGVIEAAGKVGPNDPVDVFCRLQEGFVLTEKDLETLGSIQALLAVLPKPPEGGKAG